MNIWLVNGSDSASSDRRSFITCDEKRDHWISAFFLQHESQEPRCDINNMILGDESVNKLSATILMVDSFIFFKQ